MSKLYVSRGQIRERINDVVGIAPRLKSSLVMHSDDDNDTILNVEAIISCLVILYHTTGKSRVLVKRLDIIFLLELETGHDDLNVLERTRGELDAFMFYFKGFDQLDSSRE